MGKDQRDIAKSRNHRDPHLCMADLMEHWLSSDLEASWEKVANALDEMDLRDVAVKIRKAYRSSSKIANCLHALQDVICLFLPQVLPNEKKM